MPVLPFAEFAPDAPDLGDKAREAVGVIPEANGYRPFKALATTSTALTARAQGAAWFRAADGTTKNFAGDATKLYLLSSSTWTPVPPLAAAKTITAITKANPGKVTAVGHGYSNGDTVYISGVVGMTQVNSLFFTVTVVDADNFTIGVDTSSYTAYSSGGTAKKATIYATDGTGNWRFAQFGDVAYATNGVDALQSFTLSSSSNWAAASGSPPVGTYIGVVLNFLVLAKISSYPQRVHWSGDNNTTTWASSATTLADYQDLPDGGEITGFLGGGHGLVFQEAAIRRMTFEGSPTVFRFDKIATDLGATVPNSVAGWGDLGFFCHRSGFYMIQNGQQIRPIGRDRVDRWFWGLLDQSNMHRVTATVDPLNALYIVSFPTGSGGTPSYLLIYNWKADRWSYALSTVEMIYAGATQQSWTLEDLDSFSSIESVPYSLDSSYWTGSRQLLLSGFYTDHKSGAFSGDNMAAQIDTQEMQPVSGVRSRVRGCRPLIDGGSSSVAVGTRKRQQDSVVWSSARASNADGYVPLNTQSRYMRFRVTIPSGTVYQRALGLDDIDTRAAGYR